jgi:hypothetical protein
LGHLEIKGQVEVVMVETGKYRQVEDNLDVRAEIKTEKVAERVKEVAMEILIMVNAVVIQILVES